jgi:hypothetical protein
VKRQLGGKSREIVFWYKRISSSTAHFMSDTTLDCRHANGIIEEIGPAQQLYYRCFHFASRGIGSAAPGNHQTVPTCVDVGEMATDGFA